jgi:acetate kinase
MAAALAGLDALVFTGGVVRAPTAVRAAPGAGLAFLGVDIDREANGAVTGDDEIGAAGASVHCLAVTAREDLELSRQVRALRA